MFIFAPVFRLRQKAENGGYLSKRQEQTLGSNLGNSFEVEKEAKRKQLEFEACAPYNKWTDTN